MAYRLLKVAPPPADEETMNDDPLLTAFFEEAEDQLAQLEAGLLELEERPDDRELLNAVFRSVHTLKGNAAMLGFEEIVGVSHALEDLFERLRATRRPITARATDGVLYAKDVLRALVGRARTGTASTSAERAAVDEVVATLGIVTSGEAAEPAAVVEPAAPGADDRRDGAVAPETTTLRVAVEKVDHLVNLVGELVIAQSMVSDAVAASTPERLAQLRAALALVERHTRELHEGVMGIRMVPIRTLFARFPRLVRDVTTAVGKVVVLETAGEDTELDRTVIENISDPLSHLVRNAVDHGIELPAARRAAGKPDVGRLTLRASQQSGNIYIEVEDDGRGLDRARLRARARELGIADDAIRDEDAFSLIFRPGFSTADRVTQVSGRGVGLDVVRRNVESLGGAIAIHSETGRGTTFRIKLPLTLAIVDGQFVTVGGRRFVVPLSAIVESLRPVAGQLVSVPGIGEALSVRRRVLPLLRLGTLFGVAPRSHELTDGIVVIVEHDGRQVALAVDELHGQQQVVIKSLDRHYGKVPGAAGATILGDGAVSLILDVPGLLALGSAPAPVAA
ncbi:MAG TPA: chemotaxis protein CheA [Terriglobales bacterium]|nr:chemotaxis protein CheA [Terriglobales bacterium]